MRGESIRRRQPSHPRRSFLRPHPARFTPSVRRLLLALSSVALLVAAFPSWNIWWCAWVALVPWLALLRQCTARQAFWWSSLIGLFFFLASIWWLTFVTWAGWLVLCAYLAVFFGAFGWVAHRSEPPASSFAHLILLPGVWVALEFLRSHLGSGFGWNLLAYSQAAWPEVLQLAEVTGAWGISFLIVLVNVALAECLLPVSSAATALRHVGLAALCLICTVSFGAWRMPQLPSGPIARIAVIQGNIPQEEKWDEALADRILQRYEGLTRDAARKTPQLIVWPETSARGYLGLEEDLTQRLIALARAVRTPLLIGAPMGHYVGPALRITNSAALLSETGSFLGRYDKLHLVPLGEFVPFERQAPWLRKILPPIGDFVAGAEPTVFNLGGPSAMPFSVLICFEDVFPDLARQFVQHGATLLLNITNDAWFGPTAAAYQHAQASTLRAVELRVPVIRAANTGWSGCIDAAGRWRGSVRDALGRELFVSGFVTCSVPTRSKSGQSLYLRWGDWFAGLCLVGTVSWLLIQLLVVRRFKPRRSERAK